MTNRTASDAQGAYTLVKRQTHTEMVERYGNYSFWIENALSPGFRLLLNPSLKKNPIFQSLRPETLSHSRVTLESSLATYSISRLLWPGGSASNHITYVATHWSKSPPSLICTVAWARQLVFMFLPCPLLSEGLFFNRKARTTLLKL